MAASSSSQLKFPKEVFPVEVWNEILSHLKNTPKDLVTCYKTTECWNELLQPKRQAFLMAEAFEFVGEYIQNPQDMLNSRLVCHSWRWSVDNFLANHPDHTNSNFGTNPPHSSRIGFTLDGSTVEKLEAFLSDMDDTEKGPPLPNPFFSRYICYQETTEDSPRLQPIFQQLLNLYGSEILHCKIFIASEPYEFDNRTTPLLHYKLICSFLKLMPNLKSLWLEMSRTYNYELHLKTISMDHLVLMEPIPKLEHLVALTMLNITNPLEEQMLYNYNQIRKLRFDSQNLQSDCFIFPASITLTSMDQIEELKTCARRKEDLTRLIFIWWPIKILKLEGLSHVTLKHILLATCHFGETLRELSISVIDREYEAFSNGRLMRLYLPHLRKFSLKAPEVNLETIDFLEPCLELESFRGEFMRLFDAPYLRKCRATLARTSKNFFNFDMASMYESNVWNFLPKLRKIIIETTWVGWHLRQSRTERHKYNYTREGWTTFNENLKNVFGGDQSK